MIAGELGIARFGSAKISAAQQAVPFAAELAPDASRGRVVGQVMTGLLTGILLARTASGFLGAHLGWRPVFLDYLHLGFTNATAFSPTDVMPLTHRAKYTMLVQSTVALALFGLIVARAVNAFT